MSDGPLPDHVALVLFDAAPGKTGGERVTLCSRPALACGVRGGMPLVEARALLGDAPARFEPHDRAADEAGLRHVAAWCERFSPWVGVETSPPTDSLLLDVTGCGHLHGGEVGLLKRVEDEFRALSLTVRLALADSVGTAWAVAHGARGGDGAAGIAPPGAAAHAEALGPLPVAALRLEAGVCGTLRQLGIRTVAELERLPRADLPCRFGAGTLTRLDQALGRVSESISPVRPIGVIEAAEAFEWPVTDRQALAAVVERLLDSVLKIVAGRREGIVRMSLRVGMEEPVAIGLARPTDQAAHLRGVVASRLERLRLGGPVAAVRLRVIETARLAERQGSLFEDATQRAERTAAREIDRLVDRLQSRLGDGGLVRPRLQPEFLPEHAAGFEPLPECGVRSAECGVKKKRTARSGLRPSALRPPPSAPLRHSAPRIPHSTLPATPLSRPLTLLAEPVRLEVVSVFPDGPPVRLRWEGRDHTVARCRGPERIESGWWRGRQQIQRDYFRVETESGPWLWLFRDNRHGGWFLHGLFD
jgi:protein ImuB